MKRYDPKQKIGDLQGEYKAKRGRFSSMVDFSQKRCFDEVRSTSEENQSMVSDMLTRSNGSTRINSPENGSGAGLHQIMIDSDQRDFWGSHVSDATKVYEGVKSESN